MTDSTQKLLRPHYQSLQGYVSAGMEHTKSADTTFLNANENPYELPGLEGFSQYPEPQPAALRDGYGQLYQTDPQRIVMTRGADEAIAVLTKLFCEPETDHILICPPTFGMYKVNADTMPSGVKSVPLVERDGTFALDVDGMISALDGVKLVFICSPNNPTGNVMDQGDIKRILDATQNRAMVILDETYIEFAEQDSFTTQLDSYPNLVILRTLSKSYALAGMRMGSMICADPDLAALIRTKGLDAYPLPHASIQAAQHVMRDDIQAIARSNIDKIVTERKRVAKAFAESPHITHIYPSDANFLLIKTPRAKDFIAACAQEKIIIRDFSDKDGTKDCIRLSIGLPQDNDRVIRILQDL